jgi:two-component sensor histidine kinase
MELNRSLEVMARTMTEGFALLRFCGSQSTAPELVYANEPLRRLAGARPVLSAIERLSGEGGLDWNALGKQVLTDGAAVRRVGKTLGEDGCYELHFRRAGASEMTILVTDRTEQSRQARHQAERFAELHHRLKNSLANTASLLKLQAIRGRDPLLADQLERAADRIHAIADLHAVLYDFEGFDTVDLGVYVREFCDRLEQSLFLDRRIRLQVEAQSVMAPFERAAPIGVILNELVTNATKHAYPHPSSGVIQVALRVEGAELVLAVSDFGQGLRGRAERPGGLGMRLVRSLSEQLNATLKITPLSPGVAFELRMPAPRSDGQAAPDRLC